jgi:hypothetical protein
LALLEKLTLWLHDPRGAVAASLVLSSFPQSPLLSTVSPTARLSVRLSSHFFPTLVQYPHFSGLTGHFKFFVFYLTTLKGNVDNICSITLETFQSF